MHFSWLEDFFHQVCCGLRECFHSFWQCFHSPSWPSRTYCRGIRLCKKDSDQGTSDSHGCCLPAFVARYRCHVCYTAKSTQYMNTGHHYFLNLIETRCFSKFWSILLASHPHCLIVMPNGVWLWKSNSGPWQSCCLLQWLYPEIGWYHIHFFIVVSSHNYVAFIRIIFLSDVPLGAFAISLEDLSRHSPTRFARMVPVQDIPLFVSLSTSFREVKRLSKVRW